MGDILKQEVMQSKYAISAALLSGERHYVVKSRT
jgi:hypothetical protein